MSDADNAELSPVCEEQAEQDFEKWCECWDIETDTEGFSDEEIHSYKTFKRKIIRKIKSGHCRVIDGGDVLSYTLFKPGENFNFSELEISLPNAKAMTAMDKFKDREILTRQMMYIAKMTGKPLGTIQQLHSADLKFLQAVSSLFLAS